MDHSNDRRGWEERERERSSQGREDYQRSERYGTPQRGQGAERQWRSRDDDGERSGSEWRDRGAEERRYGMPDGSRYGASSSGSSSRGGRDTSERYGRGSEEQRSDWQSGERQYGQHRGGFSPDWSQDDTRPRYSDDAYYARNREPQRQQRGSERDDAQQRGGQWRNDDRQQDDDSYYRGYYSRSVTPFSYGGGSGHLYSESWTLAGPYSGRGPKGYKRSVEQIVDEASRRLEQDGHIDASDIEVTCEDGVIKLRGTVPSRAMKRAAEECVESIYGANDVMNELRVAGQQSGREGTQSAHGGQGAEQARGIEQGRGEAGKTSESSAMNYSQQGGAKRGEDAQTQKH